MNCDDETIYMARHMGEPVRPIPIILIALVVILVVTLLAAASSPPTEPCPDGGSWSKERGCANG